MLKSAHLKSFFVAASAVALSFMGLAGTALAATTPVVVTPANNAVVTTPYNGTAYYSWTAVPQAINYHFQLDFFDKQKNAWTSIFDYNRGNYTSNYTMLYNKEGQWRVRVKALFNGGVESAYSAYNYFTYTISPKPPKLSVTTLKTPVAQNVVVGTINFPLAKFELNASNSAEDVKVTSLVITDTKFDVGASYTDFANLVLSDANGKVVATNNNTTVNGNKVTFYFSAPVSVSRLAPTVLTLKGDVVARSAVNVDTQTFNIANADKQVTAYGLISNNAVVYALQTITGTGQGMTIAAAGTVILSLVSGVNASPSIDQTVQVGTVSTSVFAFKLTTQNEAAKITSLKFTVTGSSLNQNDVVNMRLYRNLESMPFLTGQVMVCANNTCTFTWTANDNLFFDPIQPGAPVTVYVRADIAPAGQARLGDSFKFSIATTNDVVAKGAFSSQSMVVSGAPAAGGTTFIIPFAVVATGDAPTPGSNTTQAVMNGTQIGRFKVTNYGAGQISLNSLGLTDMGIHTGTTTAYSLSYSDEMSANYMANKAVTSSNDVNFMNFIAPVTLNGGSYRYFTVSIASIGTAQVGDNWSLGITTLGKVKYSVTETNLGYDGNGNGNLLDTIGLFADGKPQLGMIIKQ